MHTPEAVKALAMALSRAEQAQHATVPTARPLLTGHIGRTRLSTPTLSTVAHNSTLLTGLGRTRQESPLSGPLTPLSSVLLSVIVLSVSLLSAGHSLLTLLSSVTVKCKSPLSGQPTPLPGAYPGLSITSSLSRQISRQSAVGAEAYRSDSRSSSAAAAQGRWRLRRCSSGNAAWRPQQPR